MQENTFEPFTPIRGLLPLTVTDNVLNCSHKVDYCAHVNTLIVAFLSESLRSENYYTPQMSVYG